jgi:hypothetical protein
MSLKATIHGLWYAQLVIQVILAIVVIVRKSWRDLPAFSSYILFSATASLALYAIPGSHHSLTYFYAYWISEAGAIVLGLVIVREIFMKLFAPHLALRKLAALIFRAAIILLVAFGCAVMYAQAPGAQGVYKGVMIGEEAVRIVEVGLIMFLFLSSGAFGLHWRQNVFGIALGLGIFTSVELVGLAVFLHIGPTAGPTFSIGRVVAFSLSLLVWLGYLLAPERVTARSEVPKRAQLEQWNQAVLELISK